MPDGESYEKLLRILENSIGRYYEATNIAAKYIGGIRHTHDHAGSGRNPLVPVPGNEQRRALKLLVDNVFTA
ncbi:zinc-dependent metalloprotease, partial [Acinetobacter baumannii]